jgi:hypothetical protein
MMTGGGAEEEGGGKTAEDESHGETKQGSGGSGGSGGSSGDGGVYGSGDFLDALDHGCECDICGQAVKGTTKRKKEELIGSTYNLY